MKTIRTGFFASWIPRHGRKGSRRRCRVGRRGVAVGGGVERGCRRLHRRRSLRYPGGSRRQRNPGAAEPPWYRWFRPITINGSGFAHDGGTVTVTSNAPGVTFAGASESSPARRLFPFPRLQPAPGAYNLDLSRRCEPRWRRRLLACSS